MSKKSSFYLGVSAVAIGGATGISFLITGDFILLGLFVLNMLCGTSELKKWKRIA